MAYQYLQQLLEAQKWFKQPGIVPGALHTIGKKARARLIKRHGACAYCQSKENLTVDHRLARGLGGTNASRNLQVLCWACNQEKNKEETRLASLLQTEPGRAQIRKEFAALQRVQQRAADEKAWLRKAQREAADYILHGNAP